MSEPTLPNPNEAPDDAVVHRVEQIIGNLLRCGVLTSLALLVAGTLVSFFHSHRYGSTSDDLSVLIAKGGDFERSFAWLFGGLRDFRGQALIVLGLVFLIATPLLRVAVSVVAYIIERDLIFVLITSLVLVLLVVSFLIGGHG